MLRVCLGWVTASPGLARHQTKSWAIHFDLVDLRLGAQSLLDLEDGSDLDLLDIG